MLFCLSSFAEASILIVAFYWAPWIALAYSSTSQSGDGLTASQVDSTPMLITPPLNIEENPTLPLDLETTEEMSTMSVVTASSLPFVFIYSSLMLSTMIGESLLLSLVDRVFQGTICIRSPRITIPMTLSSKWFLDSPLLHSSSRPSPRHH
jgi:hypothetical protein